MNAMKKTAIALAAGVGVALASLPAFADDLWYEYVAPYGTNTAGMTLCGYAIELTVMGNGWTDLDYELYNNRGQLVYYNYQWDDYMHTVVYRNNAGCEVLHALYRQSGWISEQRPGHAVGFVSWIGKGDPSGLLCLPSVVKSRVPRFLRRPDSFLCEGRYAGKSRTTEVTQLIKSCVLFRDLELEDVATLAIYAHRRSYDPGEPIFNAGDPGESLMGILAGVVRITRPTVEGEELVVADFSIGDIFGEVAILDGGGRSADAIALTKCELVVLERRDLIPFLQERPNLCINLLKLLCGKLRLADQRTSDFAFLQMSERLAKALLERAGLPREGVHQGKISLTQGELAKIVGGTRWNVNRQLREWQRRGIVDMQRGWIMILDRSRLAEQTGG